MIWRATFVNITINIPKDQEQTLRNSSGNNLDRAALEALAIEG